MLTLLIDGTARLPEEGRDFPGEIGLFREGSENNPVEDDRGQTERKEDTDDRTEVEHRLGRRSRRGTDSGGGLGCRHGWLRRRCRPAERGRRVVTFERDPAKVEIAAETFRLTGMEPIVDLISGDAEENLGRVGPIAFCFLDAEKNLYLECYDALLPNMVSGGLLVADNIISHAGDLAEFLDRAESDKRVDSMIVPVGSGVLLVRRV